MVKFGWFKVVVLILILLIWIIFLLLKLWNFICEFIICKGIGKLGFIIWFDKDFLIVVLLGVIVLYMWNLLIGIKVGIKNGKFWIWF